MKREYAERDLYDECLEKIQLKKEMENRYKVGDVILYRGISKTSNIANVTKLGTIIGLYPDSNRMKYLIENKKTKTKTMIDITEIISF